MPQSPYEATFLPLRMICGDGEEGGKTTETETENEDGTKSKTKTTETETPDLESQLAEERSARIQLQRERDEAAESATQALREGQEEGDRVAGERDDYKKKYEKMKDMVETKFLDWSIDKNEKFSFHDAEAVRSMLNTKNIRLDLDTGKVEGLDAELKRIAKEKPYLVKPADGEDGNGSDNFQPPPGNTGTHPRGGSTRQRETDRAKLGTKYKIPGFSGFASSKPM